MSRIPELRIDRCNEAPVRDSGRYVLYWMIASRRTRWNFAMQRAVGWANELSKPLLILEALRCEYPWASDRLHRFVLDGMADNQRRIDASRATFYPYAEAAPGSGRGLLERLAKDACVVVTDWFPCFFLPSMVAAAAARMPVLLEQVDSNGVLPLRAADRVYRRAFDFRRFLQRTLPVHMEDSPEAEPLDRLQVAGPIELPVQVVQRWAPATSGLLDGGAPGLAALPIDHAVGQVGDRGGAEAARARLDGFIERQLSRYLDDRNEPAADATSRLSPYLHFGHISAHEIAWAVLEHEGWTPLRVGDDATGKRSGWWGVGQATEAFLDQLVTWRELGFNMAWQCEDFDRYESLPEWARQTLSQHAADRRPFLYELADLEAAATRDRVWNAAQRQLLREGRIHNYLRMLWGKKILEWSPSPRQALTAMIELNDKYATDGRDPNSYSGMFWCFGRYDRAWGPERPIFGKVRYMSSRSALRKLKLREYLEKYATACEEQPA